MSTAVAFILKGYPRLSETFIAQEIQALEARGVRIHIVSLRHPTDPVVHPVHGEIQAPVLYLPEYLHREPLRVLRAGLAVRKRPGFGAALRAWWRDLCRDWTLNRIRRFGQAMVLVHELPDGVVHLHAHFLHTPASVARYASLIAALPWTCSAHARDIWTSPDWEKREKLADCRWLVTCTANNVEHLRWVAPACASIELLYHGLDLARFPNPGMTGSARDGSDASDPVVILSVGRVVEKKGYEDLMSALALVHKDLHWRFDHVGGGADLKRVKRLCAIKGIDSMVTWHGPLAQKEVIARYARADIFVLASRIARDGDRDGLPNVLMEAQTQSVACLSTKVSAIPELIESDSTGLLVEPGNPTQLARALERLIADVALRSRLGEAGKDHMRKHFSFTEGIDRLAHKFAFATTRDSTFGPDGAVV